MSTKYYWAPQWCFIGLFALPTALAWRTHLKRRRSPTACPTCAYDRSGLAPGSPCPECGKPAR